MSMYNELLFVQQDDSYNIGVKLKKTTGRDPLEEGDLIGDWLCGLVGAHCTMLPDYHRHEDTSYFGSKGIDPHEFLEHYWYKLSSGISRSFRVFYRHEGSDMWVPANVVDDHEQIVGQSQFHYTPVGSEKRKGYCLTVKSGRDGRSNNPTPERPMERWDYEQLVVLLCTYLSPDEVAETAANVVFCESCSRCVLKHHAMMRKWEEVNDRSGALWFCEMCKEDE